MVKKEKVLQSTIAQYLRGKGCFTMVIQPQAGIPQGTADIIALAPSGRYIYIEVKAYKGAPYQPLQEHWLNLIASWGQPSYTAYPDNWEQIKTELDAII